jgi:molybdate transport system permease protein
VSSRGWFVGLSAAAIAVVLAFLALPLAAILTNVGPERLVSRLGDPVARDALLLSLETSAIALALIVVIGTPAAYMLATRRFPGRAVIATLIELPLVLPPAAAGIGLLAAFGPHGLLGGALSDAGVSLPFSTAAVVIALAFVASPFYLRQAQASFGAVDRSLLEAARTLGATPARAFLRVAIPTARSGLTAGATLAWARAVGEFGATLMFAGSLRSVTQTVPLAIYDRFAVDFPAAVALSAVLLCVSAAILLTARLVGGARVAAVGAVGGGVGASA